MGRRRNGARGVWQRARRAGGRARLTLVYLLEQLLEIIRTEVTRIAWLLPDAVEDDADGVLYEEVDPVVLVPLALVDVPPVEPDAVPDEELLRELSIVPVTSISCPA